MENPLLLELEHDGLFREREANPGDRRHIHLRAFLLVIKIEGSSTSVGSSSEKFLSETGT